ncbi:zinc ribbon domain-containing protein [Halomicrococcus gelatinilyticus]|uniref:zinc ribbon domain-containing protein n=1 Tax=Halomicrococcus gelatinilyticus TaxID=1702103 RepID=UPI002E15191C
MTSTQKRPWLAAVFAFVYPGLGHVYLRKWLRALLWFGLTIATAFVFIPESTFQAVEPGNLQAAAEATRNLGLDAVLPILAVQAINIIDAYWTAIRGNRTVSVGPDVPVGSNGASCPHCGKELEEDLDFCHWCTTQLDDDAAK